MPLTQAALHDDLVGFVGTTSQPQHDGVLPEPILHYTCEDGNYVHLPVLQTCGLSHLCDVLRARGIPFQQVLCRVREDGWGPSVQPGEQASPSILLGPW